MKLSDRLRGTTANVFTVAGAMFNVQLSGDTVFDKLDATTTVRRCELCSVWRLKRFGNAHGDGFVCTGCLDEDDEFDEC